MGASNESPRPKRLLRSLILLWPFTLGILTMLIVLPRGEEGIDASRGWPYLIAMVVMLIASLYILGPFVDDSEERYAGDQATRYCWSWAFMVTGAFAASAYYLRITVQPSRNLSRRLGWPRDIKGEHLAKAAAIWSVGVFSLLLLAAFAMLILHFLGVIQLADSG